MQGRGGKRMPVPAACAGNCGYMSLSTASDGKAQPPTSWVQRGLWNDIHDRPFSTAVKSVSFPPLWVNLSFRQDFVTAHPGHLENVCSESHSSSEC